MAVIVWVVIFVTVVLFLAWPLLRPQRASNPTTGGVDSELLARKNEVYGVLVDLEFDYRMGKLSEDDYRELRERYRLEALALLERLGAGDELEEFVERAIRARREQRKPCPVCGVWRSPEDRFCRSCGMSLIAVETRSEP